MNCVKPSGPGVARGTLYVAVVALLWPSRSWLAEGGGRQDVIGDAFEAICKIAASTGGCSYQCPLGFVKEPDPLFIPDPNGCGTQEFKVNGRHNFTDCCNLHDLCYGHCGMLKEECDRDFRVCMEAQCLETARSSREQIQCEAQARLFYNACWGLGCFAYRRAQKKACLCSRAATEGLELEPEARTQVASTGIALLTMIESVLD